MRKGRYRLTMSGQVDTWAADYQFKQFRQKALLAKTIEVSPNNYLVGYNTDSLRRFSFGSLLKGLAIVSPICGVWKLYED